MIGVPNEIFEWLKSDIPLCSACLEAYKKSPGLIACYLIRNIWEHAEEEYHVTPAIFFRRGRFAYTAPHHHSLCGSKTSRQYIIYGRHSLFDTLFSCLIYNKRSAAADLFNKPEAIFTLLSSHPCLERVPWTVELFQKIDLTCELVLHALNELKMNSR